MASSLSMLLNEAIYQLSDEAKGTAYRDSIEMLTKIHRNIKINPGCPKYREINEENKTLKNTVTNYIGGMAFLEAAGWYSKNGKLVFGLDDAALDEIMQILTSNRLVRPQEHEWKEENKLVVENPKKKREQELREKALKEKEKDLQEWKKDKEEQEKIRQRVLTEHRNDRTKRLVSGPVKGNILPLNKDKQQPNVHSPAHQQDQ